MECFNCKKDIGRMNAEDTPSCPVCDEQLCGTKCMREHEIKCRAERPEEW